jgi:hypothetical protein
MGRVSTAAEIGPDALECYAVVVTWMSESMREWQSSKPDEISRLGKLIGHPGALTPPTA